MTEPGTIPAQEVHQTQYPYVNVKQNMFVPLLSSIRRAIAPFNPLALQQIPTQDRIGLGLRWGNQFYSPQAYPNGIYFNRVFPGHYDPESGKKEETFQGQKSAPGEHSILVLTADKLPRPCVRQIQAFKRCAWVNGEEKCASEKADIIDVCPVWALEEMKEKNRFMAKVTAMQNYQYRQVMQVSDYNKGRNVGQVSDKTWIQGTRTFLRPDTMYPDERYVKITQLEITEAKARFEAKEAAKKKHHDGHGHGGHGHGHGDHHYDFSHVEIRSDKPLYP